MSPAAWPAQRCCSIQRFLNYNSGLMSVWHGPSRQARQGRGRACAAHHRKVFSLRGCCLKPAVAGPGSASASQRGSLLPRGGFRFDSDHPNARNSEFQSLCALSQFPSRWKQLPRFPGDPKSYRAALRKSPLHAASLLGRDVEGRGWSGVCRTPWQREEVCRPRSETAAA